MSEISQHVGEHDVELNEALAKASSVAEMQEIQRDWAVRRLGATRDIFSPDKLIFDEAAAQAVADAAAGTGTVSRVEKIFGVDRTFTGSSLLDVEQQINAAYREGAAAGGTADADAGAARSDNASTQARHPLTGQFQDSQNPAVQGEMKSLLIQGRITPEQYVASMPQLLDSTMKERYGIDPERVQGDRLKNAWASATEQFLNSEEGSTWPGGRENMMRLGKLLEANNRAEDPSVDTLIEAYRVMRENNMLVENPQVTAHNDIASATSFEDLRQSAWKSVGGRPRGVWNH